MIDHVQPGQTIKAATINSIIDGMAIGSNTLDVRQTDKGTQVNLRDTWNLKDDRVVDIYSVRSMQREKGEGDHLSTRAYVGLNLGVTLEECLDSVVLHLEGGMKLHPLSAGVVYKNTTTSFEGDVPGGYLLSADEFGWDASLGSTGWLSTKMEWPYGEFQPDVKLDVWKTENQKRYVAFSNVEDISVEKDQLSALLASNGESPNELSLLKLEQSFPLMRFKALEVDNEKVPANPLIHNDGEIHVWNADEGSAPVMWKADLVCYGASGDERSYCWKIWLGPDSTYDQSLQRVIVQAQDGDHFALSAVAVNDIGQVDGTNVMESPYGGYDLLFGPFTANVGSQVTEHSVYMNVKYDKTDMYVDGYFSDSPDDTDLSSDGILGRSVFIAKNAPFLVPDEQEKVADSLIRRGTWGWLDFGGPKLDSYVPATDATTSKSLEWSVPQTDNRRPCEPHLMEVKGFAHEGAVDYLSTDNVLVRRVDSAGNRELKYVSLSSLSGGGGCSCEMRQVLTAGTLIAQFTNDGQNWQDIYCLSSGGGGGGDVSCYTTLSGNVDPSQKIWGDVQFQAMTSSNVSVQTTIENGVPICRIGVFYLGWLFALGLGWLV